MFEFVSDKEFEGKPRYLWCRECNTEVKSEWCPKHSPPDRLLLIVIEETEKKLYRTKQ